MKKLIILIVAIFAINIANAQWQSNNINGILISNVKTNGNIIYASGYYINNYNPCLLYSNDQGNTWTSISSGLPAQDNIRDFVISDNNIILSMGSNGIYISSIYGNYWSSISNNFSYTQALVKNGNKILAATSQFVYSSSDNGLSWVSLDSNLSSGWNGVSAINAKDNYIYAGLSYNSAWGTGGGIYISNDYGNNWTFSTFNGNYYGVLALAIQDSIVYAGTDNGLYYTNNQGATWTNIQNSFPLNIEVSTLCTKDSIIIVGTYFGIYFSSDYGNNWTTANTGITNYNYNINDLVIHDSTVYVTVGGTIYKRTLSNLMSKPANAGIIAGPSTVCQGQNMVNYSIAPIDFATAYVWTLPDGTTDTVYPLLPTISVDVNFPFNAASALISVKGINKYGDGTPYNLPITINPAPSNAGIISGNTSVCQNNQNETYTVPLIANSTSYVWTLLNGNIDTTITNSITINYDTASFSGTIKVKGANSCGLGNENGVFVNVISLPITPNIIGSSTPQPFGIELYSVSQQFGKTYKWSINNGNILNGTGTNFINVQWGNTGVGQLIINIADNNYLSCAVSCSLTVNIGNIGIEKIKENKVEIYPNPAKDNLIIELQKAKKLQNTSVSIYNTQGQLVKHFVISQSKTEIDIHDLSTGVYVVKVINDKETLLGKFVKE